MSQNPYGQNPYAPGQYGQNPYGQMPPHIPQGQVPPQGQAPYGQNPYGPPPGAPQHQQSGPWGQQPPGGQWGAPPAPPVPPSPVPEPEPRRATFRPRDLPVATTDSLPGRTITGVLGEVVGVVTRPRDMRASADLSAVLTATRQDAVDALVTMAEQAGADAVVGLRYDGAKVNDSTAEIAAYGTAVTLEPLPAEPNPFLTGASSVEGSDPTPADDLPRTDQHGGLSPMTSATPTSATPTSATLASTSQTVKGVIARSKGAPVELVDIVVPAPGPGEAVVAITACGVCHTDLHYREGGINDEFPFLLGHEASGVVEAVGEGVTHVVPGDTVVLNWRAVCGQCRACRKGKPWYCFATHNATQKMTLTDGTELTPALGIGAFAEKTLVAAGQCTKVDPEADAAAVGLLGCGVMAGFGAAVNTGGVGRGDAVAVIGCGGVGNAAIQGARVAGATMIIAIDVDDRKLAWAKNFGATHTVNSRETDPVEAVRALTGGNGADVVIEAVGRPETYQQAFYMRDLAGTVVLVGVPTPEAKVELPLIDIFGRGGALKSSWYGDCLPERDFPMLVDLYRQGRFDLDAFVSERIGIDDVEAAFDKMHRGEVLRSVVMLDESDKKEQDR